MTCRFCTAGYERTGDGMHYTDLGFVGECLGMSDIDVELKRCPFCDGEAEMMGGLYPYVECQKCGVNFSADHSYDADFGDAARKWNARAQGEPSSAGAVPEGWKLVPEEPTEEMTNAAMEVLLHRRDIYENQYGEIVVETITPRHLLKAMLTAALTAPAVQGVEPSGVWQFYKDGEWHVGVNQNNHRENTEAAGFPTRDLYAHPHNGEQGGEWPAMPDKFYEGIGWMHAECCAALDRGEDPRAFEVGDMVKRCIHDLTRSQPPKSKEGES